MAYKYAGLYGPAPFLSATTGRPLAGAVFTVYNRDGVTLSSLYTSRTKAVAASNPTTTDIYGNGSFWADPGDYYISCEGVTLGPFTIAEDPAELYTGGRRQHDLGVASPIFGETIPRWNATSNGSVLTTQIVTLTAIELPPRTLVSNITYISATTAVTTPTNWWFVLCDSSRVVKAVSADQLTAAWAANTAKTLSVAASAYTTPDYPALHYVGIMVKAATPCTLHSAPAVVNSVVYSTWTPTITGASSTGQTTPPALSTTLAAITAGTVMPYAAVS